MQDVPDEINVVTLNCWGLKYISKLRRERLTEIGRQLAIASPQPHIVALQECFTQEDYHSIRRQTRFILPYAKFYHGAAFGAGLAILSRWPIEESTMYRYPLNGRPTAFWRGDWYVGKGVACAKIRYGPAAKQVVEVFNTHTHSPYEGGRPDDSYLCHRTAQAWEMAKLLRGAAERGHLVLAMGDFNMIPMSPEHQLVTTLAPVRDVWRVLHPDSSVGPAHHPAEEARRRPVPTAEFNIQENGAASDGPTNTWRWTKAQQKRLGPGKLPVPVSPDTPDPLGKRLDYIFAGSGDIDALGGGWVVKQARVGMMMRHPELGCSLSDHFAVEATLTFFPSPQPSPSPSPSPRASAEPPSNRDSSPTATGTLQPPDSPLLPPLTTAKTDSALQNGTFLHSAPPSSTHLPRSRSPSPSLSGSPPPPPPPPQTFPPHFNPPTLPAPTHSQILTLIKTYTAREQRQQTWRARHFFVSLLVSTACLVAVWFSPANYVAFLLVLVSSLGLVAGTVDGLLALLFFGAELRALKEFEWEVRNAGSSSITGGGGGGGEGDGDGDGDERRW
ncbi:Endonuclease/exonuclease/phosphatase [Chaetomidium leptoderma]|uniref:Endonuclease/exonuclease/phosphatase n=1 Tax=Chaetomidium leptoderma TaxID=669021 RepID=A0AAN6ZWF6_9PEZI|nr:Endonuclease/exonuclease/phosphatase [Chaetomidium leptoderma]